MSKSKILIGVTGSIACYKTCALVSRLVKEGHCVKVVATPAALKFVGSATWEGLTGEAVYEETFEAGKMMSHIDLARWADKFVIAPLTAAHAGKMACGIADDLLTALYIAYESGKPLYLAPAMNSVMWAHPAVAENFEKLAARGAYILEPAEGRLACGETGPGKMMEPDQIFEEITSPTEIDSRGRVLVVYGGTREPIDGVRSITNTSTGETGAALADALIGLGFAVKAMASHGAVQAKTTPIVERFDSALDLQSKLSAHLNDFHYDAVIHLAAVSDFRVDTIKSGGDILAPSRSIKLGSEKSLTLELSLNPKIVQGIKSAARSPKPAVIAFKLTNTRDVTERDRAITKLLLSDGIDFVVHNDLEDIDKSAGRHEFRLYAKSGDETHCENVTALAKALASAIETHRKSTKPYKPTFEVFHDSLS